MKNYFLILIILTLILFSPRIVKADNSFTIAGSAIQPISGLGNDYTPFTLYGDFEYIFNTEQYSYLYDLLFDEYNTNYASDYPYYDLVVEAGSTDKSLPLDCFEITLYLSSTKPFISSENANYPFISNSSNVSNLTAIYVNGTYVDPIYQYMYPASYTGRATVLRNYSLLNESIYDYPISFNWDYDNEFTVSPGESLPSYFDIYSPSNKYTIVDLSKYHYVLLNLKDYSKKEAFSTNLQVKGMIGITPIYNYGTTAKDDVMGNKIEDRCNLSYKDYTDHRLYILKSDLENKAIYAIKGCEDNSSFKFDNTLFDITYVTDDNIDDPIVTIDGKEYHTIPYNQLPSTATKNEEENYVPGESKELSLSEIADNVTDTLSSVWSSIITFMNLFTKFFNTLPVEIRVISITTFTTACTLGIIKILKS